MKADGDDCSLYRFFVLRQGRKRMYEHAMGRSKRHLIQRLTYLNLSTIEQYHHLWEV